MLRGDQPERVIAGAAKICWHTNRERRYPFGDHSAYGRHHDIRWNPARRASAAVLATAAIHGTTAESFGAASIVLALYLKARIEERFLRDELGEAQQIRPPRADARLTYFFVLLPEVMTWGCGALIILRLIHAAPRLPDA
jgi:hypothetical protein